MWVFFVNGLSGSECANLNLCLQRLWDTGAAVVSVAFDGSSCHFAMASELGPQVEVPRLKPNFPHPVNNAKTVHIYLDVRHMVKFVRNTFSDFGIILDASGNKTLWQYIENLHKLPNSEGLRLGSTVKAVRTQWHQQKLKGNLAAQTFSTSMADAIEYCATVSSYKNSMALQLQWHSLEFSIDCMICLTPGIPLSALCLTNKASWSSFLETAFEYISDLKTTKGEPMHMTKRKTGIIGFLPAIKTTNNLFISLTEEEHAPL